MIRNSLEAISRIICARSPLDFVPVHLSTSALRGYARDERDGASDSRRTGEEARGSGRTAFLRRLVLTAVFVLLGWTGLLPGPAAAQSSHTHQHSFGDAEKWAQVFDDPKRDAWQKPHEVIQALALKPDAVIADIGSGTGYFSVRFARMVPKGRVYGVDTEPDMVRYLAARAKRESLTNITSVAGAPDDPRLPEKADLILMVDVYHHIENRERYFRRLRDSLKPGGRIAVIDFRMDAANGPPKSVRIAPDRVKSELKSAGYTLLQEHTFLPNQYFMVFRPAKS